MKLAYLSNNAWPGNEAGLLFSLHNARGFWQAGADCVLLVHGRTAEAVPTVLRTRFDLHDPLPILPLRAPSVGGSRLLFYLRAFLALRRSDRTVLITRNVNFLPWAWLLKRHTGMRIYLEAHNLWAAPLRRAERLRLAQRRQARLERAWVPYVDGVIAISAPLARLYRCSYPGVPVLAAPPGTSSIQALQRRQFSYTLGYIGGFDAQRYPLEAVFQALARIHEPRLRFLCIGATRPGEQARVQEQARRAGIAERVHVYPWVTGPALAQLKAQIDVGVAVLGDTFLTRLVCPTKIFDYLAMAVPCIASRFDGVEAIVSHGQQGLLVEHTVAAWEHAIRYLYADFFRYQDMAAHCHTLATTLQWPERARLIVQWLAADAGAAANVSWQTNATTHANASELK
jgi:glycosyltransferase involved in cell wall biosynthesis